MPEMQDNPDLHIVLAKQRKNKKIKQKTKKPEIPDIFIKTN